MKSMKSYHFYKQEKAGSFEYLQLNKDENIMGVAGNQYFRLIRINHDEEKIETKKSAPTKEKGYHFQGIKFDFFSDNILHYGANHKQGPVLGCVDVQLMKNTNEYRCDVERMTSFDKPLSQPFVTGFSTDDGVVKLWDSRENKESQLCSFDQYINCFRYSPVDDNKFAISTRNYQFFIFDVRKPEETIRGWFGHTMDIHQVEWHPNDSSILATASMDQTVKIWNIGDVKMPLCSIKNSEVGKIHWLAGGETGSHSIGIGSKSMDKIMSVWDLSEPYCPQFAFKNKNKSCITDFAFSRDKKHAYLISQDNYVIVQSINRATSIMDERRGNSLACDLTDGYVFGWDTKSVKSGEYSISDIDKKKKVKQSKRLNFINVTNFKSCYEETENMFETMDEEYLHFITGYKTEGGKDSMMQNLLDNKNLAWKYGKIEISSIWNSLYDLMEEDSDLLEAEGNGESLEQSQIVVERRRKVSMTTKTEREKTQSIVRYYRENEQQLEYDLQTQKISIREADISIHEDYEYVLLAKIDEYFKEQKFKNLKQNLTLTKKSEIISKILQDMIDNGEFIHAYKMYSTLSDYVDITEEKRKLWEYTYIDILVTMGFYTRATETIKNSKVDTIKNMNKNDTVLKVKCIKCGKLVPKNGKGYCERCKNFSVYCAVCSRPCKGLMLWCQICSHGGHVNEIIEWFTAGDGEGKTCPTGCGCKCFKF